MKTALVTGASSGMGLIYARELAARGYDIVLVSNQQEQLSQAAADIAADYGVAAIPHFADLATPDAAAGLHGWCAEQGLEIDVLVNNAGMFFFKELCTDDLPRVRAMMNLHMTTVTELCLLFGEDMKRRGSLSGGNAGRSGHILIVSSMTAKLPTPGIAIYSATKAYLKSFGKSLYFEMKPYGVGVTTVCPAAIATPLYNIKPSLMKVGVRTGVIHTPQWLVKRALRGMFRGRPTVRPSLMNYYLPPLVRMLPRWVESRLWAKLLK